MIDRGEVLKAIEAAREGLDDVPVHPEMSKLLDQAQELQWDTHYYRLGADDA